MIPETLFTVLDRTECDALLASHHVGRMAFTFRNRVDITPLHYVYDDGWIYGRTQEGTKVRTLAHHPWVAFEVDDVVALFEWKSVVVHGRIEFPDITRSSAERDRHECGVQAIRRIVPAAFDEGDPTPHRDIVWALPLHTVEGRMAARVSKGT